MAGASGEGIKKIDGRIAHLFVFFFASLPSSRPLSLSLSLFSARAFKRHLMKIKTFYRSALAKSSNNLYLLALFPHGGFIVPRLTLTTRTHALAHTSSPAQGSWRNKSNVMNTTRDITRQILGESRAETFLRVLRNLFLFTRRATLQEGRAIPVRVLLRAMLVARFADRTDRMLILECILHVSRAITVSRITSGLRIRRNSATLPRRGCPRKRI